jgi:predicted ATP-dependent Lon-type protease
MTINPSAAPKRSLLPRTTNVRAESLRVKALEVFGRPEDDPKGHSLVVNKTLARQLGFDDYPLFVLEYVLGKFTTKKGKVNLNKARELISVGRVGNDNLAEFKHNLMEEGTAVMIGQVSINPNLDKGEHVVTISQIPDTKVGIDPNVMRHLVAKHPALLNSAVWGNFGVSWQDKLTLLDSFDPYQITMNPRDMARFKEGRREFTILEWIDLLITSMGYNPSVLDYGVDAGERTKEGRIIYRPYPHPGDEWKVGDKTYQLIEHPTLYCVYDTGETKDTGRKDKHRKPILEPILATPVYLTGKKDAQGKDIWAPVWTPLVNVDEVSGEPAPITDQDGNPLYFHAPDLRRRLLLLARLLPLCVKNFNLVELGPRGTGKSFLLRNLSPKVYLLSGGKVTDPQLRGSLQTGRKTVGLLSTYQVLVFDEVSKIKVPDLSLVGALQDYLESGNLGRGGQTRMSDCSTVWGGNIDMAPNGQGPMYPSESWLRVFPKEINDKALFERFHCLIPGWELPKITDEFVTPEGVGFLADYFGEVLSQFRNDRAVEDLVANEVIVEATTPDGKSVVPSIREQKSIQKMITGYLRMLYPQPDAQIEPAIYELLFQVVAELRQNIHDQLVKIAKGEYYPKQLSCRFK